MVACVRDPAVCEPGMAWSVGRFSNAVLAKAHPPEPDGDRVETCVRGGLAPWQVRRAKQIMRENLGGLTTLEQLAAACRLSKNHFARAFKATTGQPPHRWLLNSRVEWAKRLMIEGDHPLADIALICGFADQSHFARVFRQFVGISPGNWRRAQEAMAYF